MNLDIENLKKKLIDNGLCVDNEFLDKYCLLIINNKSTPKEKFKKSINGEKISYDINHDSNSKHLNKEDIVEIINIKWYKL